MTINYTTLLGLAKPVTGTETGQWGDVVNDSITSLLEDAVANAATISVTAGNVTLTTTNGSSNQARMSTLILTGTPGTTRNVVAPSQSKIYVVLNQSDSSVVIKGSATTGVTLAAGAKTTVVWNGSDFVEASTVSGQTILGNLTVNGNTTLGDAAGDTITINGATTFANVNPTLSAGTANGVLYLNGSKVATSGSALTFDATNLVLGANKFIVKNAVGDGSGLQIYQAASDVSSIFNYYNGAIAFGVNNAEQMRLNTTGLGIGTSSPAYKLQVAGTSGTVGIGLTGTHAANDIGLYISPSAITGAYSAINSVPSATGAVGYTFANGNNANSAAHSRVDVQVGGASAGDPKTTYTVSGVLNWSVGVDNSDSDKFKISGSDSPGSSDYLTIDTSGNLGIGTSSPATKLEASGVIRASSGTGQLNIGITGGIPYIQGYDSATAGNRQLAFYTGTEVMRLDSSGNLGLGVTPYAWGTYSGIIDLKGNGSVAAYNQSILMAANAYYNGTNFIYKATTSAGYHQIAGNQFQWFQAPSGTAGNAITFTQAMTLDASGNLGIGTTSPTNPLQVNGNIVTTDGTTVNRMTRSGGVGLFGTTSNHPIAFQTNDTERARIDTSGNLLINLTSSIGTGKLQVRGGIFGDTSSGDQNLPIECSTGGTIYSNSIYQSTSAAAATVTITGTAGYLQRSTASSQRYKDNIENWSGNGLETIMALQPRTFTYKAEHYKHTERIMLGLIAEEVAEVNPMLADYQNEDGTGLVENVRYAYIVVPLIKAIQEQQAIIEQLTSRIAALETK